MITIMRYRLKYHQHKIFRQNKHSQTSNKSTVIQSSLNRGAEMEKLNNLLIILRQQWLVDKKMDINILLAKCQ